MGQQDDSSKPLLSGSGATTKRFKSLHDEPRSCNDLLFVVLFALCCAGMAIISGIAFKHGDPSLLIPSNTQEFIDKYAQASVQGWFENAVAQARLDSDILIGAVAMAVVLGIVWVQLMKAFTKLFIYVSLILGVAAVVALAGYFLNMGLKQSNEGIKIVSFVLFAFAALLLITMFLLRKKIAITCAMFTETCRGVQHNPALFPVCLLVVAIFLGFAAYWVSSFIYLYSIPGESIDTDSTEPPKFDQRIRNLMFFMVFGFLWVSAFLSGVFQHVVAGAIATWYFSRDVTGPRPIGSPSVTSLVRAFTTSMGSLAFGSLLIATVEFLNFLLQMAKRSNSQNKLLVFVASCMQCILGCIEGIVRYVNKFAYIHVAMHGYSFCKAAKECFDLVSRNFFTTVIMDVISGFVLFMGKILFTAISVILTIGIVDNLGRQLSIVTVGLTGAISFVVLHIISHIIGAGINAVFVCYLEDLENNKDGNLYISPDLHQMLQDKASENRSKTSKV
jgi:hypothetical protein